MLPLSAVFLLAPLPLPWACKYIKCIQTSELYLFYIKSTNGKKKKGVHKNGLYCYLHIYNEKYKKKGVVHSCLRSGGHGPQIKQKIMCIWKKKKSHHRHWTCITPFITQLTASFIFSSLLSPLILTSVFPLLLPLAKKKKAFFSVI